MRHFIWKNNFSECSKTMLRRLSSARIYFTTKDKSKLWINALLTMDFPCTPDSSVKVNSTSTLLHRLDLLSVCFIYPMSGRYSTTGTRKVDPARKFKCTTAARVSQKSLLQPGNLLCYPKIWWIILFYYHYLLKWVWFAFPPSHPQQCKHCILR